MSGDQHHAFAKGPFVVWKAGLTRAHRYRRDIWLPHGPAVSGFLRAWPCARYATRFEDIPHGRRFPFAAPRRGNASPVESGGDLTERLRPCSLSLAYRGMGPRSATRNGLLRADQAADEMNVTRQPIELGDSNRARLPFAAGLGQLWPSVSESDGGTRVSFPSTDPGREVFQPNAVVGLCQGRPLLPACRLHGPSPADR
jgi:hypothetical protein